MFMNECQETEMVPAGTYRSEIERNQTAEAYGSPYYQLSSRWYTPPLEVVENEDEFRVIVELPGVGEQDVSTTLTHNLLVIHGEKKPHDGATADDLCACSERAFGPFRRTVRIPSFVDTDKVNARYENGLLEVFLPKKDSAKPRSIEVKTS